GVDLLLDLVADGVDGVAPVLDLLVGGAAVAVLVGEGGEAERAEAQEPSGGDRSDAGAGHGWGIPPRRAGQTARSPRRPRARGRGGTRPVRGARRARRARG